jgi:hypothetical protein
VIPDDFSIGSIGQKADVRMRPWLGRAAAFISAC